MSLLQLGNGFLIICLKKKWLFLTFIKKFSRWFFSTFCLSFIIIIDLNFCKSTRSLTRPRSVLIRICKLLHFVLLVLSVYSIDLFLLLLLLWLEKQGAKRGRKSLNHGREGSFNWVYTYVVLIAIAYFTHESKLGRPWKQ